MGSGKVDYNWAKEHHSLWVEELESERPEKPQQPAPSGVRQQPAE